MALADVRELLKHLPKDVAEPVTERRFPPPWSVVHFLTTFDVIVAGPNWSRKLPRPLKPF
jgi:hypothetical protein